MENDCGVLDMRSFYNLFCPLWCFCFCWRKLYTSLIPVFGSFAVVLRFHRMFSVGRLVKAGGIVSQLSFLLLESNCHVSITLDNDLSKDLFGLGLESLKSFTCKVLMVRGRPIVSSNRLVSEM